MSPVRAPQAACNSDAKTIETAVQAFIDSPDNTNNTAPGTVQDLSHRAPAADGIKATDQFLPRGPTNNAYAIALGANGAVMVAAPATATAVEYDAPGGGANPCSNAS